MALGGLPSAGHVTLGAFPVLVIIIATLAVLVIIIVALAVLVVIVMALAVLFIIVAVLVIVAGSTRRIRGRRRGLAWLGAATLGTQG